MKSADPIMFPPSSRMAAPAMISPLVTMPLMRSKCSGRAAWRRAGFGVGAVVGKYEELGHGASYFLWIDDGSLVAARRETEPHRAPRFWLGRSGAALGPRPGMAQGGRGLGGIPPVWALPVLIAVCQRRVERTIRELLGLNAMSTPWLPTMRLLLCIASRDQTAGSCHR